MLCLVVENDLLFAFEQDLQRTGSGVGVVSSPDPAVIATNEGELDRHGVTYQNYGIV